MVSLVPQMVKSPHVMQEPQVWFLGQEEPLEKEMTTHSSILAWRIPWNEEPGRLSPWGCKELDMTKLLSLSFPSWLPSCGHEAPASDEI